jgi:hypothetical protein
MASYVYISTVIREMFKIPCKKYLSGSEKTNKKTKHVRGRCKKN